MDYVDVLVEKQIGCEYLHKLVKLIGEQRYLSEKKMMVTGLMKQVCIHSQDGAN